MVIHVDVLRASLDVLRAGLDVLRAGLGEGALVEGLGSGVSCGRSWSGIFFIISDCILEKALDAIVDLAEIFITASKFD